MCMLVLICMFFLNHFTSGKSSLLNILLRREAAIVTPLAGTTRDVIDGFLNLGGFPVRLTDTAGLRDDGLADAVER